MKDLDELKRETESDLRAARERREGRQARDRRNGPILAAYDRMAAGQPVEHTPGPRHAPRGGVIELPYLDGVQHAAFPEVRHAR